MGILVSQFGVGGFDKNFSYVLHDECPTEAVIIDPSGDLTNVHSYIRTNKLHISGIYLTHTHHDHFDALDEILEQYPNILIYVHALGVQELPHNVNVVPLLDRQELTLGGHKLTILHTPGHTDDGVCVYVAKEDAADGIPKVITGDTLFVGGCGRTTAQRVKDLYESLAELGTLPGETCIYPGHDYGDTPTATIAHELATNRFYQVTSLQEFITLRLSHV